MKSTHFLNEAIETQAQRAADHNYGEQGERTAAHVARIFNAITGRNLKERDIWAMLLALKLARNEAAPGGEDTLIDLVSYASLLAECDYAAEVKRQEDAEKENQQNTDRSQLHDLGNSMAPPDSWRSFDGGTMPVGAEIIVDVKTRHGDIITKQNAGLHEWNWRSLPGQSSADIVAYRIWSHWNDCKPLCGGTMPEKAAAAYQAQQDEGWKDWDGKHSDGPITMAGLFDVKFRSGVTINRAVKKDIFWAWLCHPLTKHDNDVVAWRPAK